MTIESSSDMEFILLDPLFWRSDYRRASFALRSDVAFRFLVGSERQDFNHETIMNEEPKIETSCPFCGDTEDFELAESDVPGKHAVFCNTCFCEGPPRQTKEQAVESWNERPSPWQPMDTAPRDCNILVTFMNGSVELWSTRYCDCPIRGEILVLPTAWMPLPAPYVSYVPQ